MTVKIRLSRGGTKKRPYYYIVAATSSAPRDGRYIEQIGTFNPMLPKDHADRLKLDLDRAKQAEEIGSTALAQTALKGGQITMYPEYVGVILSVTFGRKTTPPTASSRR